MQVHPSSLVSEVAVGLSGAISVFERHGIDYCCRGQRPLEEACRERGIEVAEVLQELAQLRGPQGGEQDWSKLPLTELMAHIVGYFHANLRRQLPFLRGLAARVREHHGDQRPELAQIEEHLEALEEEIGFHARKEEDVLFPMIESLEQGGDLGQVLYGTLDGPVQAMEEEHLEVAQHLESLRLLTGGYTPPEGACVSFQSLYQGLAELETETHEHIHLENNVLFPRAEALAQGTQVQV